MIKVRRADERGHANYGWLDTHYSFSFADYFDPKHMGFRSLRVINEDVVQPGRGFGTHPHKDMEILTYVLEGELEHRDSMGTGSVIRPGEVQRMSAGTGVTHSEFNHSKEKPVHLLQIWILPEKKGLQPSYEQKAFNHAHQPGWRVVAERESENGALNLHQDVRMLRGIVGNDKEETYAIAPDRHAWVQVARSQVEINGTALHAGDGAALTGETLVRAIAKGDSPAEVLLFDMA